MDIDSRYLFEILIRENAEMLRVYLRSAVRDRDAVEDVFQETIVVAWETLDRFDRTRPFGPWLRGIAAKKVLAHYRKINNGAILCNETTLEELDCRMSDLHRQPGDTLGEKLECLRKCMAELSESFREVIQQRYAQMLSRQAMAEQLGVTEEAVKKRLQRARTQLLDCVLRRLAQREEEA